MNFLQYSVCGFHIPLRLELHSPRIVGRVRPLLVGSWVLVEASSGHRGKPRLPVSLSPPYRHRQPLQKLRICEIGRKDFLPKKIRFLWSTNLIFRKFWAKRKNQHWGVGAQGVLFMLAGIYTHPLGPYCLNSNPWVVHFCLFCSSELSIAV